MVANGLNRECAKRAKFLKFNNLFVIRTSNFWDDAVWLIISRISATNVLKCSFENIIVGTECRVVVSIRTNQPEARLRFI